RVQRFEPRNFGLEQSGTISTTARALTRQALTETALRDAVLRGTADSRGLAGTTAQSLGAFNSFPPESISRAAVPAGTGASTAPYLLLLSCLFFGFVQSPSSECPTTRLRSEPKHLGVREDLPPGSDFSRVQTLYITG